MTKRSHQETSVEEAHSMGKKLDDDNNMDEFLSALGYKVRSSDMADVAQKLEQLEVVLSNDDVFFEKRAFKLKNIKSLQDRMMKPYSEIKLA